MTRILQNLVMASGQRITPENTLIIFDEIQDCPDAINSLKYFCEHAPQYHVACAGSLLGIALAKPASFPVGKVDFMQIEPMTFTEFLIANGDGSLAQYMDSVESFSPVPDAFFNPLHEKLKMYFSTGGMPEPVLMWTAMRDVEAVQKSLADIIGAYERDFGKHPDVSQFPKISLIWRSIPSQLARENKKLYRSTSPGLPVAACDDLTAFKIYLGDVGILRRLSLLSPTAFAEKNRLFTEFKGALTENFILQAMTAQFQVPLRYWSQSNPPYEVDFLLQRENDIIPLEVKASGNTQSRSLKKFKQLFPEQVKLRVRFSLDNLALHADVLNIPLFMADHADRLMGKALS